MNHDSTLFDLIIIGGGPAGASAGVYAARKQLKTLFLTKDFNGQSAVSEDIQNWIGTVSIKGSELAENLKKHLLAYAGNFLKLKEGEYALKVSKNDSIFSVKTNSGEYLSKTVLVTTGSHRRKLEIPGAKEFENKGITYCASCDGPLFSDQDVVVIGGGNAAFETSAQLLAYCKSVTLIQRGKDFRADEITVNKVLANPKMKAVTNTELVSIAGEQFVTSITYKDLNTEKNVTLPTTGIFVEIGLLPSTEFVKGLVKMDEWNHIIVDPRTQRAYLLSSTPSETTLDARRGESDAGDVVSTTATASQRFHNKADGVVSGGVWAAGDCTDGLYHQNNIASGDAVKALEDIYLYLHAGK